MRRAGPVCQPIAGRKGIDGLIAVVQQRHTSDGIHRLLAFAGLDPRIRSSGQWTGKVRMSKRGSSTLRTAIWRAAFVASRHPAFAPMYHKHRVEMKQPFLLALSHVARKVTQAIYGVLRHQAAFNEEAFAKGPDSPMLAAIRSTSPSSVAYLRQAPSAPAPVG